MKIPKLIIRKARSAFRTIFKLPPPLVRAKLLEKEFLVREQTIRDVSDKDDAWLLACAFDVHRIFDVGANIGQAAFIELYPDSVEHVLLVDPNPMALSIAAENLILNHLIDRTNLVCTFLSHQSGKEVDFYTVLYGAAGSMYRTHAVTAAKRNLHFKVPTSTVDQLCEKFGYPDFIKIDVEGAEVLVLQGAKDCMLRHKTKFLVEMHSSLESPMMGNAQKVLDICESTGYHAWYLSRKVPLKEPEQLADRGRCHLLLQPVEWDWPEKVVAIKQDTPLTASLLNQLANTVN